MNPIKCVKCGQLAAFQTAVKEPYTCLTCQVPEQPTPPEQESVKAIGSKDLLDSLRERFLLRAKVSDQAIAQSLEIKNYGDAHDSCLRKAIWLYAAEMVTQEMLSNIRN